MTPTNRLALAALLLAPAAQAMQAGSAKPDQGPLDTTAAVLRAIEPPTQEVADALAKGEVYEAVSTILKRNGDMDQVAVFGDAADVALRQLIEEASLSDLSTDIHTNPLIVLLRHRTSAGIDYLDELQRTSPSQFNVIERGGMGVSFVLRSIEFAAADTPQLAALCDRVIGHDDLALERRLKIAASALNRGVEGPAMNQMIDANLERFVDQNGKTIRRHVFPSIRRVFGDSLPEAPDPVALHLLKYGRDPGTLAVLTGSKSANVRRETADAISAGIRDQWLRPETSIQMLTKLCSDSDLGVLLASADAVALLVEAAPGVLSPDELATILEGLSHGSTPQIYTINELKAELLSQLQSADPGSASAIERSLRAVLEGPLRKTGIRVQEAARSASLPEASALAYLKIALSSDLVDQGFAHKMMVRCLSQHPGKQGLARQFLELAQGNPATVQVLRPYVLQAPPAGEQEAALRLLGATGEEYGSAALESVMTWKGAEETMRTSLMDESRPAQEHALALAYLMGSSNTRDQDAAAMAMRLRALLKDPQSAAEMTRIRDQFYERDQYVRSPHWLAVLRELHADDGIPDAVRQQYQPNSPATTPEQLRDMAALVDLADARRLANPSVSENRSFIEHALQTATKSDPKANPLAGHDELVLRWAKHYRSSGMCVDYVLKHQPSMTSALMDRLAVTMQNTSGSWQQGVVRDFLRIPTDDAIPRLLQATRATSSPGLAKYVEERVSEQLRIREIEARWSDAGGRVVDKESATQAVLKLLDHANEDVRIEAIRGLATLGALEALPALIERAGSDSAKEAAAAKAALDLLHRRAASQIEADEQSAPVK